MSDSTLDQRAQFPKQSITTNSLRSLTSPLSPSSPAHVTGTAAGLAAAGMVIVAGLIHYFTGGTLSPANMASGTTIITYLLGAYLHVPST